YAQDWQRAVNASRRIFPGGGHSFDDDYYQGSGLRRDSLLGATLNSNFGSMVDLKTTVYHNSDEFQGHWYTPYTAST
ncbi:TonB-dependent receptor, partial [Undibacterium sp. CCC1.1]|nr:TonB-dependent receptor [Undibacterium sp. CCC1.1]